MARNALQAVLDRAKTVESPPAPVVETAAPPPAARRVAAKSEPSTPAPKAEEPVGFYRPSREGKQLVAGHFPKSVAKQLKLLSVEEDTTVQELLAEALDLLFVKKGRARIAEITRRAE